MVNTVCLLYLMFIFACITLSIRGSKGSLDEPDSEDVSFQIVSQSAKVQFAVQPKNGKGADVKYEWKITENEGNGLLQLSNSTKVVLSVDGGNSYDSVASILLETISVLEQNKDSGNNGNQLRASASLASMLVQSKLGDFETNTKPIHLVNSVKITEMLTVEGVIASTASGDFTVQGVPQWKMLTHEDFHKGTVTDWVNSGDQSPLPPNNAVSTCADENAHSFSDYFLGSYGGMKASKIFILPAHTMIRIESRFHFIDDWNGETGFVQADGKIVWSLSHTWCDKLMKTLCKPSSPAEVKETGSYTIDVCGHPDFPDRLSVPVSATLKHTANTIKITFGSNIPNNNGSEATWGADDLRIYVK